MITLSHIHRQFGNHVIYTDLSTAIEEGARVCIVGKSGVGKSLLMKIILGLEKLNGGQVTFGTYQWGADREDIPSELLSKCGVVFQGNALFDSLTIRENVGLKLDEAHQLPKEEIDQLVVTALDAVGLKRDIWDLLPSSLSGGMQKRVAIARAIIDRPPFLFYDEPTTGLDPVNAAVIDELMLSLALEQDRTSIVITHDVQTVAMFATQVIMLSEEGIIFDGAKEYFLSDPHPEIQQFLNRHYSRRIT
ncbi:MAG: ATP-binding cassette domain-containing protein [Bacteroidota bacterium]